MRYTHAGSRRSRTVFGLLLGRRTEGRYGSTFRLLYPPEPLNGFPKISGDGYAIREERFHPPSRAAPGAGKASGQNSLRYYAPWIHVHRRSAPASVGGDGADRRAMGRKIGLYLLEKHPADVMMFTFMSIDTVQHHFWQYLDAGGIFCMMRSEPNDSRMRLRGFAGLPAAGWHCGPIPGEASLKRLSSWWSRTTAAVRFQIA